MNTTQIAAYEFRLKSGAEVLGRLEAAGATDHRYDRRLRRWLELLAAYEYECEIAQIGEQVALAAGS